jgi:hypothetical protein
MRRVVTVLLVFALMVGMTGVDTVSLRAEQGTSKAQAHRQKMADRANRIPLNTIVEIRHADGRKFKALLQDVGADAITAVVVDERNRGDKVVIPFADLRRIDPVRDHTVRNVLIGVGVGVGALFLLVVGTCAAAANPGGARQPRAAGNAQP